MRRLKLSEVTQPGNYLIRKKDGRWQGLLIEDGLFVGKDGLKTVAEYDDPHDVFGPLPEPERLEAMQKLCILAEFWTSSTRAVQAVAQGVSKLHPIDADTSQRIARDALLAAVDDLHSDSGSATPVSPASLERKRGN